MCLYTNRQSIKIYFDVVFHCNIKIWPNLEGERAAQYNCE